MTVKVNPHGALLDLKFDADALDLEPTELAALVLATARTASEEVAEALTAAVAPVEEPLDLGARPGAEAQPTSGADLR